MGLPVGRSNQYMPVTGGATQILDSGIATLSTGGSASVTTTTPQNGNSIYVYQYSTLKGATTSCGPFHVSKATNLTSFNVASKTGTVGANRNSFYWEIRSRA